MAHREELNIVTAVCLLYFHLSGSCDGARREKRTRDDGRGSRALLSIEIMASNNY